MSLPAWAGANTFTAGGWTGGGSLTGGDGSDTVVAGKDADFTLTNTALSAGDGLDLTLAAVEVANLTGGAGNNTFTGSPPRKRLNDGSWNTKAANQSLHLTGAAGRLFVVQRLSRGPGR